MKKFGIPALIFSLLLMCSCTKSESIDKIVINNTFSAKITLHYNRTAYTADFVTDKIGCSAVFLSPDEINGLKTSTDGTYFTCSFDEVEFQSNKNNVQLLPLDAIYQALIATPISIEKNENGYTIAGTTKYGKYIMNINNITYTPTYLEYTEEELTVRFEINT